MQRDPSSFYRLNEEIALELGRLEAAGQLDRLRELVGAAGTELAVSSIRAREGLEELIGVLQERDGWDHESYLAARSQFTVVLPDGNAREVYMPDHICPSCYNDARNAIDSCSRNCAACGFAW